jgi:hypothetical protein
MSIGSRPTVNVVIFCANSNELRQYTRDFLLAEGVSDPNITFTGREGVCKVDVYNASRIATDLLACGASEVDYFILEFCPNSDVNMDRAQKYMEDAEYEKVLREVYPDNTLKSYYINLLDKKGVLSMLRTVGKPGAKVVTVTSNSRPGTPQYIWRLGPVPADRLPRSIISQRIVRTPGNTWGVFTLAPP